MGIIEELENKIKLLSNRIEQSQNLLKNAEEGKIKLSLVAFASAELSIEKNTFLLNKYTQKLIKLSNEDLLLVNENEKTKEEIQRRNYFKYQIQRIKRSKSRKQNEIENALIIMEELPVEIQLEDEDIFEIGNKSKELFLDIHTDLDDDLLEIKNEFLKLVENKFDEKTNELKLLNYRIPIIILQLRTLLHNVKENIKELNLKNFKGFPRFQDWWIHELWISHQAYLGLFKWKKIVMSLFLSCEQRKAFENIFANWILVKKILNVKGESGYFYNHAFDMMILKYAELEEEKEEKNLLSLKNIVQEVTKKTEFSFVNDKSILINDYVKFKLEKQFELKK
ncbi:MAG: hypothetical protein WBG69_07370 [Arcobacteraceae bacterium]